MIFDAVFRYLPFFLTVLRYWVPPQCPPPSADAYHIRYYFLADFHITGYATHAVLRKYDLKKNIIGWAEDNSETDFQ